MEPFIGEISLFPYNRAPVGWVVCGGPVLRINQYTALFALIGTSFGGDGRTTFALPDLRSKVPLTSQGSYLSPCKVFSRSEPDRWCGGLAAADLCLLDLPLCGAIHAPHRNRVK
jgi:hypothetical protein